MKKSSATLPASSWSLHFYALHILCFMLFSCKPFFYQLFFLQLYHIIAPRLLVILFTPVVARGCHKQTKKNIFNFLRNFLCRLFACNLAPVRHFLIIKSIPQFLVFCLVKIYDEWLTLFILTRRKDVPLVVERKKAKCIWSESKKTHERTK